MPNGVGAPPGALMVGDGISVKPVGEHSPLYRIQWRTGRKAPGTP